MLHSHESLDRPGADDGFRAEGESTLAPTGIRLLAPLRHPGFRLLWSGMTVSLLGDGIFLVALAWEAYQLWNAPAALSVVGIAMTVPTVALLLPAGVLSDRLDRRLIMIVADAIRVTAVGALAILTLTDTLRLWQLVALVAVYGSGTAFFTPAFEAMVPSLLPRADLAAANSLDQFVRPIAGRLAGPALGGWLVAAFGAGTAFAVDAASFGGSLLVLSVLAAPEQAPAGETGSLSALKEGLVFVKDRVWLWGTLASAAIAYLLFMGPTEVLLPYLVKNTLHGTAGDLGLVFAAGGIGAIFAAIVMAQHGHPDRDVTFTYACWTVATLAVAGYGAATASWQLMLACLLFNALETAGTIVWATIKQRHVPSSMLGRVSSLDWLVSIGLVPLSFALTAPVASALGTRATLIGAAVLGGGFTFGALLLPGMRTIETRTGDLEPRPHGAEVPSRP
jgi:DHA3 family tetracycline resistance protein-like MFS transporter